MRTFSVEIQIRKGAGPEWITKTRPVYFEAPQDRGPESTLKALAVQKVETDLYTSDDFPAYGKNWKVLKVYETTAAGND